MQKNIWQRLNSALLIPLFVRWCDGSNRVYALDFHNEQQQFEYILFYLHFVRLC